MFFCASCFASQTDNSLCAWYSLFQSACLLIHRGCNICSNTSPTLTRTFLSMYKKTASDILLNCPAFSVRPRRNCYECHQHIVAPYVGLKIFPSTKNSYDEYKNKLQGPDLHILQKPNRVIELAHSHLIGAFVELILVCFSFYSGYGALFNDSIEDHKRVEYLSGYIGSTVTALRYTCSALCNHGKRKVVFFSTNT